MNGLHLINGIPILVSEYATRRKEVLIRKCRSKKKRQCNKWIKNKKNYKEVEVPTIYMVSDNFIDKKKLICHPRLVNALERSCYDKQTITTKNN